MRKVELDLDDHAENLRAYEAAKERHRVACNRVRNLEQEIGNAKFDRDEASKRLDVAETKVAAAMLAVLLPKLNEPQGDQAAPVLSEGTGQ